MAIRVGCGIEPCRGELPACPRRDAAARQTWTSATAWHYLANSSAAHLDSARRSHFNRRQPGCHRNAHADANGAIYSLPCPNGASVTHGSGLAVRNPGRD